MHHFYIEIPGLVHPTIITLMQRRIRERREADIESTLLMQDGGLLIGNRWPGCPMIECDSEAVRYA